MSDISSNYSIIREGCALIRIKADRVLRVTGMDCFEALDEVFSMDLEILLPNRGITGLFLDDDGHVISFATAFKGDEDYVLFTQDITADALTDHLTKKFGDQDAAVTSLSDTHDQLCIVGPLAEKAMEQNLGEDILGLSYLTFEENPDIEQLVFRMGYTGEYEYRVLVPTGDTEIATKLSAPGDDFEVVEIDEDGQSLLRLEMRTLTYTELNEARDPLAAGLHWMVDFRKPEFPGQAALQARLDTLEQAGLMVLFDAGADVQTGDNLKIEDEIVGKVAACGYSPTLDAVIALCYIDRAFAWVDVCFEVGGKSDQVIGQGVSAPMFVTRTVSDA